MTAVHTNNNIYWNGYVRASRERAIDIRVTKQLQSCGLHSRFLCRDCFVFKPEPYCLPYALLYFHALKLTHHMQLKGVPLGNTNQDMLYAYEDNVEMYGSASWELIALKQTIKRDDIYVRITRGEHDVMKDPLCTGDHEHYYLYNTADSTLTRDSSTQRLFQHMREQYNSKQCLLQN